MGLIHLLIAVVVLVNVIASVAVLRVSVFSTQQRLLQLVLIWFVPIIGAVVCAAFASSQALGPAPLNKMDPLYDRGAPEGPGIGICGCGNIDSGGDGGGGSD
jgi:hypothetical protein